MLRIQRRRLVGLVGLGSAGLLGGALFFQYGMGLPPCPLCIWQRWPHGIAIALVLMALLLPGVAPLAVPLTMLALLVGAGIAGYHVGVEQGWWESATCGAPDITGKSASELLQALQAAPLVPCDEVVWSLFGISMAGWNGLVSLALAGLLLIAMSLRPGRV
jgi:disulfide bond formation protein DsbB